MTKVYVDFDGTLACSSLDDMFKDKCKELGIEKALKWYGKQYVNNLELNLALIAHLRALKTQGIELVLWTNRGEEQRQMTMENLGVYSELFSQYMFRSGKKGKDVLDGAVFDNEDKYLECGVIGISVTFKAKKVA